MLKTYMVFSRIGGSEEGACLVFAHNVQEARRVAWKENTGVRNMVDDEWVDVAARLLKDKKHLFEQADLEKLAADEAHYIEDPTACKDCGNWCEPINTEGYCPDCQGDIQEEMTRDG